jgi:hypothetical protein
LVRTIAGDFAGIDLYAAGADAEEFFLTGRRIDAVEEEE